MLRFFKNKAELSDEDLVQLYQKSEDLEVLGKLYGRYMELVYGVCLKYFKNSNDSEDAVMSIFEELVVKVKKYEILKFRSWLHVFAKNYCLMRLRKSNKSVLNIHFDPEFMQSLDISHPIDDDYILETTIKEEALNKCISQLPEQQKVCIQLFYYQGKSYKEIAEIKSENLSKVRSNIQNGKRNLKKCMEQSTLKNE